jgi:hypothetical protein
MFNATLLAARASWSASPLSRALTRPNTGCNASINRIENSSTLNMLPLFRAMKSAQPPSGSESQRVSRARRKPRRAQRERSP